MGVLFDTVVKCKVLGEHKGRGRSVGGRRGPRSSAVVCVRRGAEQGRVLACDVTHHVTAMTSPNTTRHRHGTTTTPYERITHSPLCMYLHEDSTASNYLIKDFVYTQLCTGNWRRKCPNNN